MAFLKYPGTLLPQKGTVEEARRAILDLLAKINAEAQINTDQADEIATIQSDLTTIQNQVDGTFVDYSAISTIVGWTTYTTKQIFYKKIGKTVFVQFLIDGTSNSVNTTFTLPYACALGCDVRFNTAYTRNGGTVATGGPNGQLPAGGSTITFYVTGTTLWSNTLTKTISGQFFYETT